MRKIILSCIFLFFISSVVAQDTIRVQKMLNQAYEFEAKEPEKALALYRKIYTISEAEEYPMGAFKATMYSGIVKSDMAQYDSALYYYRKAIPLSNQAKSIRSKALTYTNIGNVYQFKGLLDSVPEYYLKAIQNFELLNDSLNTSNTYRNLSTLFSTLDQLDKQVAYLEKAIETIPRDEVALLGMYYGDLGLVYIDKKNTAKAFKYFNRADSIVKTGEYPRLNFFSDRNLGEYYFHTEAYQKAIIYYEKAVKAGEGISDAFYKNEMLINLGLAQYELKRYSEATSYLKKALAFGIDIEAIEIQKKASLSLSKVFQSQGNFENAYQYYKMHTSLKDSLVNTSKITIINELETKYQTEKKDKTILQNELSLEKSQAKSKIMNIILFSFLVGLLLVWFSFRQRQKRIQQQLISVQKEQEVRTLESIIAGEEKERLRIAQELHDGVNGDLSAIKYKLSSLLKMNNEVINEAVTMIDNSCQQVRAISHNLVPQSLKDFNLFEAVESYCENMNTAHKPQISFHEMGTTVILDKKVEVHIFRMIQELVTNAIKHAEATTIDVQISNHNDTLLITVEDDGKGYATSQEKDAGIGLQNIESRVAYLNANFDIVSNKNGTSNTIELDLKQMNEN